jgi:hypothetical protein
MEGTIMAMIVICPMTGMPRAYGPFTDFETELRPWLKRNIPDRYKTPQGGYTDEVVILDLNPGYKGYVD